MEPRLKEVWPRSTKFERRCYELLRDAYVKARYSRHYRISDEQLASVPPVSQMKFCDGHRTLEQVVTKLLDHQSHKVAALKAAAS